MLPTPLGFFDNCQYFLISRNDLEGAYLVCKSGRYCHPRWMGSGDGLRDVKEKWGAVKFVSPPLSPKHTHTHTSLRALYLTVIPCFYQHYLLFQISPTKMCASVVLRLPALSCCVLPFSACLYKRIFNWWAVLLFNYQGGGMSCCCCCCRQLPFSSKFPFLHYRPVVIYNITLIHTVIQWTPN